MTADLVCVDPEKIFDFWPHARPLIMAALERTRLSNIEDIETEVLEGRQLLWLAWSDHIEAAAITHLSAGVCTLTACSGHQMERWLPLFARIEKYAKDECCSTMRIYGRIGWQRVLKDYKIAHVILEKDL